MTPPVYVSNSSPLIGFERLERLDILQALTGTLYIPSAVREEVFGVRPLPAWLIERPITQPTSSITLAPRLGAGEREAITLALEIGHCYLLLDDLAARRSAQSFQIDVIGTVGLLILAKQRHDLAAIQPALDLLRHSDFRISDRLYRLALGHVGEN